MTLPLASLGIDVKGHRMTKKLLRQWTAEKKPHTVYLHPYGGIYTTKGDGYYTSTEYQWASVEEFWQYAARRHQGRAIMWESR